MPKKKQPMPSVVAPFSVPSPVDKTISPFQRELISRSLTQYKAALSQVFISTMKHYNTDAGSLHHIFVINHYARSHHYLPSFLAVLFACNWLNNTFGYITTDMLMKYTGYSSRSVYRITDQLVAKNYIQKHPRIRFDLTTSGKNMIAVITNEIYKKTVELYIK